MFSVDLSIRESDAHVVVELRGELDVADAAGVAAALAGVLARPRQAVVDLAGLTFIDCSGVTALMQACTRARRAGGDLLLATPSQQVLRVLTLTGLIDQFSVHPSVAEAADSARRSRPAVQPDAAGSSVLLPAE
jgi:anti-sigma B factor antagonist